MPATRLNTFLGNNSVKSNQIEPSSIDNSKIASATITSDKLAPGAAIPIGAVFHFASSSAPTGFLKCNGDTLPNGVGTVQGITANFSSLYSILGSTYGSAGKLPDLRGEFIRSWDDSKGTDSGRVFGSSQLDAFQGHYHAKSANIQAGTAIYGANAGGNTYGGANANILEPTTDGTNGSPRTGSETRPRNIALLACIKY